MRWPISKVQKPGCAFGRSYIKTLRTPETVSPWGNFTVDFIFTTAVTGPTMVVRLPSGSAAAIALA